MALLFSFCMPPSYAFQEGLLINRPSEKSILPKQTNILNKYNFNLTDFQIIGFLIIEWNFIRKGIMYQKKCVYLHPKIDKRNVEQCGKHLYCPKLKFRQNNPEDKIQSGFLLFRVCFGLCHYIS